MFENNYNSELTIKKWARIFMYCSYAIIGLSIIGALIVLFQDAKNLWLLAFGILLSGSLSGFGLMFASHLTWGFGHIVGNICKNKTKCNAHDTKEENILPEL